MKTKAWLITVLALILPSMIYARVPVLRLMNLYDPNTEVTLEGNALTDMNSESISSRNPVVLPIALEKRKILVILGPSWYVRDLNFNVKKGQRIQVVGSKVYGPEGRIYIIARKMTVPNKERDLVFRDESYIPIWKAKGIGPMPPIPVRVPVSIHHRSHDHR